MTAAAVDYTMLRERLTGMLRERGLDTPDQVIQGVPDDQLDGVIGAIALYDDMQKSYKPPGPGFLFRKIADGGVPGYKPANRRTSTEDVSERTGTTVLTAGRTTALRGSIIGGAMTRDEAVDFLTKHAEAMKTDPYKLLDSVMGVNFAGVPPHPCNPYTWKPPWDAYPDDGLGGRRYDLLCNRAVRTIPVDLTMAPIPGESTWNYARRFWDYADPEDWDVAAVREQTRQRAAVRRAEAVDRRNAERAAQDPAVGLADPIVSKQVNPPMVAPGRDLDDPGPMEPSPEEWA